MNVPHSLEEDAVFLYLYNRGLGKELATAGILN